MQMILSTESNNLAQTGQGQSLAKGQRSGQIKVGYVGYHSMWSDETNIGNIFHTFITPGSKVIGKNTFCHRLVKGDGQKLT